MKNMIIANEGDFIESEGGIVADGEYEVEGDGMLYDTDEILDSGMMIGGGMAFDGDMMVGGGMVATDDMAFGGDMMFDGDMMYGDGMVSSASAGITVDGLLSNWFFVGGVTGGVLVLSIVIGLLLAKLRIKKGFDVYED